jgi:hypothetical protein
MQEFLQLENGVLDLAAPGAAFRLATGFFNFGI